MFILFIRLVSTIMSKPKCASDNFTAARASGLEAQIQLLMDRSEISDVVQRYGHSTDIKDFSLYRTCFADSIEMHFSGTVSLDKTIYSGDEWTELARKFHST